LKSCAIAGADTQHTVTSAQAHTRKPFIFLTIEHLFKNSK
jgi:hypothetical protein